MNAIETTATVDAARDHLTLAQPLPEEAGSTVKVIVIPVDEIRKPKKSVDWFEAIGSMYRDFPDEPRRTTAEWMAELRAGEQD